MLVMKKTKKDSISVQTNIKQHTMFSVPDDQQSMVIGIFPARFNIIQKDFYTF